LSLLVRRTVTSTGLPWIDHADSGIPEILDIAGGQGRAASPANGGDLSVEPIDRQARVIALGNDKRIPPGSIVTM
jgi:hypothetical protein